jgi:cytochrome c553
MKQLFPAKPLPATHRAAASRARHHLRPAMAGLLALALGWSYGIADAADEKRAQEIVEGKCFICHGMAGESSSPVFPRLAGQHAEYVARQLADYQSGRRKSTTMQPMVEGLTPDDFKALGRYFENSETHLHPVDDAALARVGQFIFERGNPFSGVAACAGCHGTNGHGTPQLPRVAGQHAQYVEKQLKAFNERERTNDNAVMQSVAEKLTELERKAVSAYISGLR